MKEILMFNSKMTKASLVAVAAFTLTLGACNKDSGSATAGLVVRPLPDNKALLEFEGGKVTAKDVQDLVKSRLKNFDEEAVDLYKKAAERVLVTKLLEVEAKKKGLSGPEAVVAEAVKAEPIADAAVAKFMKDNNLEKGIKDPRSGQTRKVSKDEVRMYLEQQGMQEKQQEFIQNLMANAKVKNLLEEPRAKVSENPLSPFKGGASAKVVIHEFSDFECPFCARGRDVVDQIAAAYGDKVKIVFRHFPLDFHQNAKPAAIASHCAHKQGKFWEMHNLMFSNQKELNEANYQKWAGQIGLDKGLFAECLKSEEPGNTLAADMAEAEKVGVNSTPTYFVNGQRVAGALPFSKFKSMIDSELAK